MLSSFSSNTIAGGAFQGTLLQLSFKNASGDNLQLNYEDLPGVIRPLEDVPGTYETEYFIDCGGVDCRGDFFQRGDSSGDAVVTAVSTPEPATLTLVGIGIVGLFWCGKRNSLTEITAHSRRFFESVGLRRQACVLAVWGWPWFTVFQAVGNLGGHRLGRLGEKPRLQIEGMPQLPAT
jgi:hypothetical protein